MPEPYLEIQTADGARELPITDKPITVGRHSSNMIVLTDGMASRYHCVIERTPDGLRIRDLDSSNGTRVNGQVVKTWRLGDGDVVQIGRSSITVHAPFAAPKPVSVPANEAEDDDFDVEVVGNKRSEYSAQHQVDLALAQVPKFQRRRTVLNHTDDDFGEATR